MDISTEVAAIQAASEGSELRQPLVDALDKLNSGTLPAVTVSDVGKILKVGANGWEVGEKSGYMPVPIATKQITENGTYDVTDFASAIVNVSGGGGVIILYGDNIPDSSIGTNGQIYLTTRDLLQDFVTSQSELNIAVTANSNWAGYDPWKAFTSSTGWIGNGGNPHWLQVESQNEVEILEIYFKSRDGNRSHAVSRIGYSDDGTNFTDAVLAETTMINNIGHVLFDGVCRAKYFRLYFDGIYGTSTYPMVSALEIYISGTKIAQPYLKVNGTWVLLIGSDISDVITGN